MTRLYFVADSLVAYKPDLIVISGLHLLESESNEFRQQRLVDLAKYLKKIDKKLPIHLELASMVIEDFLKTLVTAIFPLVDSVGLNEQELSFLTVALDGPHRTDGDLRQWPPEIGNLSTLSILFLCSAITTKRRNARRRISME